MLMSARSSVAQTQTDRYGWSTTASVTHTQEVNRVRNDEPFPNRIWNGLDAGLTFTTRTPRSLFGVYGRVGANVFDDQQFENQLTYGAGFTWDYRTSSRSNMSLTQSFNKNLRLDTLSDLGLVPNDFNTTSATTTWSFQQRSGPRTSWSVGAGYSFTELGNRTPIRPSQIVLNESPFGNEISIPLIDTSAPTEIDLPNGEEQILRILTTEGLVDRTARSQTLYGSFGLNHAIGERTKIGFNVNGGYQTINTSVAGDGPASRAQAFFQRALTTSNFANVGYTFERSFVVEPQTTIQTLFGGWTYASDSSSFSATVFGGASRFQADGAEAATQPVANVSVSGNLTPSTSASASYRRQFTMPLGFGRSLLMDYTSANLTQTFGARVTASIDAGGSFGSDPLVEGSQIDTRRAGANASVRIVGGLRAGANYYYIQNEQVAEDFSVFETYGTWSVYISYGADF